MQSHSHSPKNAQQPTTQQPSHKQAHKKETDINAAPGVFLQTKLTVNTPGDRYEREADAVADRILRMPNGAALTQPSLTPVQGVQRKCASCEEEEEMLQRKQSESGTPAITPALSTQLSSTKGLGNPLPLATQRFMGSAIGADFSGVRVHTDGAAVSMNRQLNARAFTYGSDIYFGRGEYAPESAAGKRLLGHELAHVVQQGGDKTGIQRQDAGTATTSPIPSTVTIGTTCTRQDIVDIVSESLTWLDDIYQQLLGYDADEVFSDLLPPGTAHARVAGSLQQAFNTTDLQYVEVIRRRFFHMANMLRAQGRITIDCFGTHCSSGGASFTAAYVAGPNALTMCSVGTVGNRPIATFIHELAHAVIPQVGISKPITASERGVRDRAYRGDRAFRFLNPEETLDNADSYAVLAELLHSRALTQIVSPAADTAQGCSQPNQVLEAFARADQWHAFALHELDLDVRLLRGNPLSSLNSGNLQMLNNAFPDITTTAQLIAMRDAFQQLKTSGFDGSNWGFGCARDNDRQCRDGVVAYSYGGRVKADSVELRSMTAPHVVSLCSGWFSLSQTDRIRTIYAAFAIGRPAWIVQGFDLNHILNTIDGAQSLANVVIPAPTTAHAGEHIESDNQFHLANRGSLP